MEMKQMLCFLFISVNGETAMGTTINGDESTVDGFGGDDEDGKDKCSDLATDENSSDSDGDSTGMR